MFLGAHDHGPGTGCQDFYCSGQYGAANGDQGRDRQVEASSRERRRLRALKFGLNGLENVRRSMKTVKNHLISGADEAQRAEEEPARFTDPLLKARNEEESAFEAPDHGQEEALGS